MDTKEFFNKVISVINDNKSKNYANALKKGSLVYVNYCNTIMQAKVLELQTIFCLKGIVNCLTATTSFTLLLANGVTYKSNEHEHPIVLYKSVDDVRHNSNGFVRIVETRLKTTSLFCQLLYQYFGIKTIHGYYIFHKANTSPYRVEMNGMVYYHNDNEICFLNKYRKELNNTTIEELEDMGIYTSYDEAYNNYQPQVLCFDENETIEEEPQTINIQIFAKGSKENIANMISKLAKENNIEVRTI